MPSIDFEKKIKITLYSGAVGGKTGKTSVIPEFSKIERRGSAPHVVLPSQDTCAVLVTPLLYEYFFQNECLGLPKH